MLFNIDKRHFRRMISVLSFKVGYESLANAFFLWNEELKCCVVFGFSLRHNSQQCLGTTFAFNF